MVLTGIVAGIVSFFGYGIYHTRQEAEPRATWSRVLDNPEGEWSRDTQLLRTARQTREEQEIEQKVAREEVTQRKVRELFNNLHNKDFSVNISVDRAGFQAIATAALVDFLYENANGADAKIKKLGEILKKEGGASSGELKKFLEENNGFVDDAVNKIAKYATANRANAQDATATVPGLCKAIEGSSVSHSAANNINAGNNFGNNLLLRQVRMGGSQPVLQHNIPSDQSMANLSSSSSERGEYLPVLQHNIPLDQDLGSFSSSSSERGDNLPVLQHNISLDQDSAQPNLRRSNSERVPLMSGSRLSTLQQNDGRAGAQSAQGR